MPTSKPVTVDVDLRITVLLPWSPDPKNVCEAILTVDADEIARKVVEGSAMAARVVRVSTADGKVYEPSVVSTWG